MSEIFWQVERVKVSHPRRIAPPLHSSLQIPGNSICPLSCLSSLPLLTHIPSSPCFNPVILLNPSPILLFLIFTSLLILGPKLDWVLYCSTITFQIINFSYARPRGRGWYGGRRRFSWGRRGVSWGRSGRRGWRLAPHAIISSSPYFSTPYGVIPCSIIPWTIIPRAIIPWTIA